jgi:hypothetical protein
VRSHIAALAQLLPFVVDTEGAHVTVREEAERTAWQS